MDSVANVCAVSSTRRGSIGTLVKAECVCDVPVTAWAGKGAWCRARKVRCLGSRRGHCGRDSGGGVGAHAISYRRRPQDGDISVPCRGIQHGQKGACTPGAGMRGETECKSVVDFCIDTYSLSPQYGDANAVHVKRSHEVADIGADGSYALSE